MMDRPPFPPRDAEGLELTPWLALQPQAEPQPAPAAQPPVSTPVAEPVKPTPEELAERRRAARFARALAQVQKQRGRLRRHTLISMTAVVIISGVITYFGSDNAHDLLVRHHTSSGAAWLLYPALEAGLIVEIQIGGVLAEHKRRVAFWGTALRVVTAVAAVTLCAAGPGEVGDNWGAIYHALGPVVQFFIAEFLAHGRAEFKGAADDLDRDAEDHKNAATAPPKQRDTKTPKRSPKTTQAGPAAPRETAAAAAVEDQEVETGTGPALVLTPQEKKALTAIQRKGLRVSKRTVIEEVRAAGGAIGTTRALAIAREWGPGSGGPELSVVHEKEA